MDPLHTFADVVQLVEDKHSNPTAFNTFENGEWKHISTESFLFDLKRLTYGLVSMGLRRGDKIGILAQSSPQWTMADFAIIIAGGISVPIFSRISNENFIYEIAQANIRFIFIEGQDQWAMYDTHRTLFEKVIALGDPGSIELSDGVSNLHEVLIEGEKLWGKQPSLWDELKNKLHADDIATIIYTAGSTGLPKGVMLSHQNLCHLISFDVFGWGEPGDIYLNVLPLAHVFARQISLIMITWGVSIYYLNNLSRMAEVCKKIKPNLMIVVPRLLEKIYDTMLARAKSTPNPLLRKIALWAFDLARDPSESFLKKYLLRPIADLLVYSKLRKPLGDRWRVVLCGGAALNHDINRFFIRIGMPVYEGWGLTEGSTACVNRPGLSKVGTVGPPLPGVKVTLGALDEILIGGPTVMKGYYRHPDATKVAIDERGLLHTGDKGKFDENGFLQIVGRVKEQFKLSSGEYVVPGRIEQLIRSNHPLIDMAMVIGEKKKYAACLLFPDMDLLKRLKNEQDMADLTDEDFLNSYYVQKEIANLLENVNKRVNTSEKIIKTKFIPITPTIEGGELTPTLRLKRDVILEKYHGLIEAMYEEKI